MRISARPTKACCTNLSEFIAGTTRKALRPNKGGVSQKPAFFSKLLFFIVLLVIGIGLRIIIVRILPPLTRGFFRMKISRRSNGVMGYVRLGYSPSQFPHGILKNLYDLSKNRIGNFLAPSDHRDVSTIACDGCKLCKNYLHLQQDHMRDPWELCDILLNEGDKLLG